ADDQGGVDRAHSELTARRRASRFEDERGAPGHRAFLCARRPPRTCSPPRPALYCGTKKERQIGEAGRENSLEEEIPNASALVVRPPFRPRAANYRERPLAAAPPPSLGGSAPGDRDAGWPGPGATARTGGAGAVHRAGRKPRHDGGPGHRRSAAREERSVRHPPFPHADQPRPFFAGCASTTARTSVMSWLSAG